MDLMQFIKMSILESLQADLDAANRLIEQQAKLIARQDRSIMNMAEQLRQSQADAVDAKYHRDMYRRDLDAIKGGINTTNAQE